MGELKKGDILHIKVGCADVGDGQPWIPTSEDLEQACATWEAAVPEGVKVVVTHFAMKAEIIDGNLKVEPMAHDMSPFGLVEVEITEPDRPQWPEDLFDDEGLLKLTQAEYFKMRDEHGYGPATLVSDRSKVLNGVPNPREQYKHYDNYMLAHSQDLKMTDVERGEVVATR